MKPMTLTKSRFVMAVECPRKLVYSTDARYHNTRADDDFLAALAQSGHLIGTLAKLMHPGGIEITASSVEDQIIQTNALLDRENVTLFVDVLVKEGTDIRLIEVKSKSAGNTLGAFSASGHSIRSKWRPYVYDVAFQRWLFSRIYG
jgi:hypothetical protein